MGGVSRRKLLLLLLAPTAAALMLLRLESIVSLLLLLLWVLVLSRCAMIASVLVSTPLLLLLLPTLIGTGRMIRRLLVRPLRLVTPAAAAGEALVGVVAHPLWGLGLVGEGGGVGTAELATTRTVLIVWAAEVPLLGLGRRRRLLPL